MTKTKKETSAIKVDKSKTKTKKDAISLYQLKITLSGSKPAIWRRVIVKDNIRLDQLHDVIQISMGWTNSHLNQFIIEGTRYGIPDEEFDTKAKDERKVALNSVITEPKSTFLYQYDFGDSWEHKIVLEKILPPDASESPLLVAGKYNCPPEDCGGIWGFYSFLEAINDPDHEEHESMLEWVGGDYDPELLDIDETNRMLKRYCR